MPRPGENSSWATASATGGSACPPAPSGTGSGISRTVVQAYLAKSELPPDPLTPREREVLQLVAAGKTTKEVAELLGISVKTAESHRTHIMQKLDTSNTAGVVRYAIRQGLIQV